MQSGLGRKIGKVTFENLQKSKILSVLYKCNKWNGMNTRSYAISLDIKQNEKYTFYIEQNVTNARQD